eukprot:TRINITY_DN24260_c0_g2_i1.p1 TRINITY_DN24260_c0_g2~~TRINITY_DN24260_c0_g2_i1.p1  ORF type:complete len:560 (-),score=176.60 TRINITY_DN24260_c0_g2_i1:63-1742(-)
MSSEEKSSSEGISIASSFPDVTVPEVTLLEFLTSDWSKRPADYRTLVDSASGRVLTYSQIAALVDNVALGFTSARGAKQNDVLGVCAANSVDFLPLFLGFSKFGGIMSPMNNKYTPREIAFQLNNSGAKYLVCDTTTLANCIEALNQLEAIPATMQEIFVIGDLKPEAAPISDKFVIRAFSELIQLGEAVADRNPEYAKLDPKTQVIAIPYSSGTSGLSKGVELTHFNLVANICQISQEGLISWTPEDNILVVLPLYHIYGLTVLGLAGLKLGVSLVVMSAFEPKAFLQTLQDYGITQAYIVPPIIVFLAKHPLVDQFNLKSIKSIFSGAAPLGAEVTRAVATRLGISDIRQGYGMTELSPVSHIQIKTKSGKYGTIGRLVPNTVCKVVDPETQKVLGVGESGELWIKGPQVMKGYLNNAEATAATLDQDGFLHTGDIGYFDEDGDFFIVDRLKELIKVKGFQVAPAELEALLLTHEAVADVAVIPVVDDDAGEVPKAFVVLKKGIEVTAEQIMAFVAATVAPHKKIKFVEFIEAIPKSPSGKILRRLLKDKEKEKRNK